MKKTALVSIFLIFILGCTKIDYTPQIDLGVDSYSTSINQVSPILSNGSSVTVVMTLTIGAKYSIQVLDMLEKEHKVIGFTAESTTTIKKLDLSDLKDGDYTLVLVDIKGKEIKRHIIIKK